MLRVAFVLRSTEIQPVFFRFVLPRVFVYDCPPVRRFGGVQVGFFFLAWLRVHLPTCASLRRRAGGLFFWFICPLVGRFSGNTWKYID